jgi:hypothetical protein
VGFQLVELQPRGWQAQGGGAFPSGQRLEYLHTSTKVGGVSYTILVGDVGAADIDAVEVNFADGTVIRDEVDDALFVFVVPTADVAQELRLIAGAGEVQEQVMLGPPLQLGG